MLPENDIDILTPQTLKSCSKCRTRRVKCDMKLPSCSNCIKRGNLCDMTDNVGYSYQTVKKLQDEIKSLKNNPLNENNTNCPSRKVSLLHGQKKPTTTFPSPNNRSEVLEKISSEIGSLSSLNSKAI